MKYNECIVEMDVYIDKKEKVWVINVNAYDVNMNTALYSREELDVLVNMKKEGGEDMSCQPDFRVVEEETATLPSEQMFYQLPMDMHHLSSEESINAFIQNMKREPEEEEGEYIVEKYK